MTHNFSFAVCLLIAISSVHSASYFYRAGREVIVPTVDEVKEVISELKKDEPVIIEEIIALPNVPEIVEPVIPAMAAKSAPESVVVENNVIAADVVVPPIVPSEVVSEEARSKPNPAIRLDTLEVIQPGNERSDKVQTVAETVKIAAVQAIEKQNEEIEKTKPVEPVAEIADAKVVDAPIVKSVEVPAVPVVESVGIVKSPEPVVPVVKDEKVVEVVKDVESVRSADPEPSKPEVVKDEKVEKIEKVEKVEEPVVKEKAGPVVEKDEAVVTSPERQDSGAQPAQPGNPVTSFFNQIQQQVQNTFSSAINSIVPPAFRPPQSDATAPSAPGGLNTNEVTNAAIPTQAVPAPTTASPNLVQNIQNAFANIFPRPTATPAAAIDAPTSSQTGTRGDQLAQGATQAPATSSPNIIANLASNVQNAISQITNIFPRPTVVPAVAPAAAAAAANPGPNIVKGTRGDEDEVEVVQNIDVVNDKVDLAKKEQ